MPLTRKTPLRRTGSKPHTPSMEPSTPVHTDQNRGSARKGIRPVSAKRLSMASLRAACREAVIARDGECQYNARAVAKGFEATRCAGGWHVHEPAKRSHGADATNPDECVLLCARHHDVVHQYPKFSEHLGLLERSAGYPLRHVNSVEVE